MRTTSLLWMGLAATLFFGCPSDDTDDDDDDSAVGDDDTTGGDDDTAPIAEVVAPRGIKNLLFEEFTNVGCGPCAEQNPLIDEFLEAVGVGNVVPVKVHTDWPDSEDLFYLLDSTDCDSRIGYYGVEAVPDTVVEGQYDLGWHGENYYSEISAYFAVDLLVDLGMSFTDNLDGTYDVVVDALATEALDEQRELSLRVMATQIYLEYGSAPGGNGETVFHDSVIGFLPDAEGTPVALGPGDEQSVELSFELAADWDADQLAFVAFLQDDATREVLQAITSEPVSVRSFRVVETEPAGVLIETDAPRTFSFDVQNSGPFPNTFDLVVDGEVPGGWAVSWTVDGAEPGDEPTLDLDLGASGTIEVVVDPAGEVGTFPLTFSVTPHCMDEPLIQVPITISTYGADVLLVDADGGDDYETYFSAALDAVGVTHAIWQSDIDFETIDLSRFAWVVWNAGWYFPHFVEEEKAALTDYLDSGGKVFFSGQDIGWDLSEDGTHGASASPWLDQEWYEATMHAVYNNDLSDSWTVEGVVGDPITAGLAFDIAGGTGADNQQYPSWVEPGPDAEQILVYDNGEGAGIRCEHGDGKVVYIAFGFEAIADEVSRTALMERALNWLALP